MDLCEVVRSQRHRNHPYLHLFPILDHHFMSPSQVFVRQLQVSTHLAIWINQQNALLTCTHVFTHISCSHPGLRSTDEALSNTTSRSTASAPLLPTSRNSAFYPAGPHPLVDAFHGTPLLLCTIHYEYFI